MDAESKREMIRAVEMAYSASASGNVLTPHDVACAVLLGLRLENPERALAFTDALAADELSRLAATIMRRASEKAGRGQMWLDLPEYERIPELIEVEGGFVELGVASLEQFRKAIAKKEARLAAYDYARRSQSNMKRDKIVVSEMRRLDARVAPYFANNR